MSNGVSSLDVTYLAQAKEEVRLNIAQLRSHISKFSAGWVL